MVTQQNPTNRMTKPQYRTQILDFSTAADVDFLLISPQLLLNYILTQQIRHDFATTKDHLQNLNTTGLWGVGLDQTFARYSFNRDFHITFGRQLTSLGFDDEAPFALLQLLTQMPVRACIKIITTEFELTLTTVALVCLGFTSYWTNMISIR